MRLPAIGCRPPRRATRRRRDAAGRVRSGGGPPRRARRQPPPRRSATRHVGGHRNPDPQVTGLPDEAGQPPPLRADDHHERPDAGLQVVHGHLAVGGRPDRPPETLPAGRPDSARVRLTTPGNRHPGHQRPRWCAGGPCAVIPAARRSGRNTPCAPNAAAERITAPRLRGSVTPSRATSRTAPRARRPRASRSSNGS